jgi:serine protease Do
MESRREGNPRFRYPTVGLLLFALLALGFPNRLLTERTHALEHDRLRADTEEPGQASQDLARVEEVSHAFRLVARTAQPGVAHIRVGGGAEARVRLAELERRQEEIRARLKEIERTLKDKPDDVPSLDEILALYNERRAIEQQMEEQLERLQPASGSGIVFDEEGHILTSNHVIEGRDEIHVQLPDEREYEATLIGADPKTDLAMIKIAASGLQPLKFGDSDELEVGDWVIAVGAPFGLSQTVTHGIISATGRAYIRELLNRGVLYQNFLQTDAAINPGNSGGPLLNLRGEVIGVNTAIATNGDGYYAGIAFAIPSNMAVNIANQLKQTGEVARGWLGITMGELTAADREVFGVEGRRGVLVDAVVEGAPAEQAGMFVEDVILTVNGKPVANMAELRGLIADVPPGENTSFDLVRGGEHMTIAVRLGRRPDDEEFRRSTALMRRARSLEALGVYVRTLLADYASPLGYDEDDRGVLVLANIEGAADPPEISPEELIVGCNGRSVETVAALSRVLEQVKKGERVTLDVVNADGERRTVRCRRK